MDLESALIAGDSKRNLKRENVKKDTKLKSICMQFQPVKKIFFRKVTVNKNIRSNIRKAEAKRKEAISCDRL